MSNRTRFEVEELGLDPNAPHDVAALTSKRAELEAGPALAPKQDEVFPVESPPAPPEEGALEPPTEAQLPEPEAVSETEAQSEPEVVTPTETPKKKPAKKS
jgi:hypothetical protein